jgi:hypothetical protein
MIKFWLLWLHLFADLRCLVVLGFRSKSSLAAENLFLRKQLAFYQERKIRTRRTSPPARLTLLLLSRWFNWHSALTVVSPEPSSVGTARASSCSGVGNANLAGRGFRWTSNI